MPQGVVTKHLIDLITKQVDDHALVVWYDPERHYRSVAADLTLPNTTVARYDGSFLQVRRDIDSLLNEQHPPRLLLYVPMDQGETDHALIELEAAGVVIQPGQQPPNRNTRLSLIARNALRPIRGEANAADIEKQVEAGKLSLADLDKIGEKKDSGVLFLIFGTGNPQEATLGFVARKAFVAANGARMAARAIWGEYFRTHDAFLMPTGYTAAPPHDHAPALSRMVKTPTGERPQHDLFFWISFATLAGLPATIAPAGRTPGGLPAGLQIVGPFLEDATPIAVAGHLADVIGGFRPPGDYAGVN
jgi:hypothetical protein